MEELRRIQRQCAGANAEQHPCLVSFVGNTGAGKSSLIEVLIGHLWDPGINDRDLRDILVPVAGDTTDTLPTSSDIHLYHDPIGARKKPSSPFLFADCEGFGAANHSAAANSRAKSIKNMEKEAPDDVRRDPTSLREWTFQQFETAMRFVKRRLSWLGANADRSEVVEELFPKIVYNISDIVVYVVAETNLKSMGKVLEKLVQWSQKAEVSSVNRTCLPSLIILVNQCDPAKTKEWDSNKARDQILEENAYLMEKSGTIRNRKEELARFDLPHQSIKDILENSYADVKFLRLPTAKDTSRLRLQFKELYEAIDKLTTTMQEAKKGINMLLSQEQLHQLYELTLDHFSRSTTSPFDFFEALLSVNPPPAEFSNNFSTLLQATFEAVKREDPTLSHESIFNILAKAAAPMICSTIAMDSRRRKFPGLLSHIFQGDTSEPPSGNQGVRDGSYEKTVETVVEGFTHSNLPCGYTFRGPNGEERTCVNTRRAHEHRGNNMSSHQDATGVRFGSGPFNESVVDRFKQLWGYYVVTALENVERAKALPSLWDFHREAIRDLHNLVPGVDLRRLPVCVWCMRNPPTESLSCGHLICPSCVVGVGTRNENNDTVFTVEVCDQHPGGGEALPPREFRLPETVR